MEIFLKNFLHFANELSELKKYKKPSGFSWNFLAKSLESSYIFSKRRFCYISGGNLQTKDDC